MKSIIYLSRLISLAFTFRRHGALRALASIDMVPSGLIWLLRLTTFYIPHKAGLSDSSGERLAKAFCAMGPSYIKLGQTLATRPDVVGEEIAKGLTTLQDRLSAFEYKDAKSTIEKELLRDIDDLFKSFDPKPVAAASIAQVHKATLKTGQHVAVKILRPGVKKQFAKDLSLFRWIAENAEKHSKKARRLRPMAVIQALSESVNREMDFRLEAAAAAELSEDMQTFDGYRIPNIFWQYTSEKILTTEWIEGIRLSDAEALTANGHDTRKLARVIIHAFLTQAMHQGFFHADLHQGNLLVDAKGTIVAIDFGIMGRLSMKERRFMAEILHGFLIRDYMRVAEVHFDAGYVPTDQSLEDFAQALRAIAEPILDLPVNEMSAGKLLSQLFSTTERFNMETQPQLILLQRSMVMAEGLAIHLDPGANIFETSRPVLEEWAKEHLSPLTQLTESLQRIPPLLVKLPEALEIFIESQIQPKEPKDQNINQQSFWAKVLPGVGLSAFFGFIYLLIVSIMAILN